MNLAERNSEYLEYITRYLDESCFIWPNEPQQILFESIRYSLLAGGKRLRPIFTFEFCRMCGGQWRKAVEFAAAVEMIHTYSLIHDDLPCMDNDDYRRGKLTNHKVYGEAIAVLSGDALLTSAFNTIIRAAYTPETKVRAVEVLSACAGEIGMVGGQVLDILSEERQCTQQEVLDIQRRKTGALIKAACVLGVLAGGGTATQVHAAETFADHLGLAFQIRDDMLDVIGDAKELGKAVGVDENKNTFVQLYGLEACDQMVHEHTQKALDALSCFTDTGFMTELANKLTGRTF